MVNIVSIASELGYISLPDNILIDVDQLKNYPDEKTVIITTGSQGESMAMMEIPTIATTAPGTGSRISPTITPVKTAK